MTQTQKKSTPTVTNLHEGKSSPASRMLAPFEEFDQFFSQLRNRDWMHPFHWPDAVQSHIPMFAEGKLPKVDIIDNDKDLLIRAELPGVDKKDLDISMTDSSVSIKASTSYENKEEKGDYYRSEIAQGQYLRTLGLPADVDIEHAKSTFKNGVLELTVPKLKHSQRRSIKVD
jgi:HSP20 family protein